MNVRINFLYRPGTVADRRLAPDLQPGFVPNLIIRPAALDKRRKK